MKTCYRSVKTLLTHTHTHGTHSDCLLLQKSVRILLSLAIANPAIPVAAGRFAIGQMLI